MPTKASNLIKKWEKRISPNLVGKTIAKIEYLTEEEGRISGWHKLPLVIIFTDGSCLFPMSDDEGNEGGSFATTIKGLETIPCIYR